MLGIFHVERPQLQVGQTGPRFLPRYTITAKVTNEVMTDVANAGLSVLVGLVLGNRPLPMQKVEEGVRVIMTAAGSAIAAVVPSADDVNFFSHSLH